MAMSREIILELPYPPSLNNCRAVVRGRLITTKAGRQYHERVAETVFCAGLRGYFGAARLAVLIEVYPPDRRKRDIANAEKLVSDGLCKGLLYDDDEQIDDLRILRRGVSPSGKLVLTVREI